MNPRVYAELCKHAYLSTRGTTPLPGDFEVFSTSDEVISHSFPAHHAATTKAYPSGYVGVAYRHTKTGLIVQANAGTDLAYYGDDVWLSNLGSDLKLGVFKRIPTAHRESEAFYCKIKAKHERLYPRSPFIIEHTGHSLGGVHAALHGVSHPHERVITFEAPGVRELLPFHLQTGDYDNVTNYVMPDNLVNQTNFRVGHTYRLQPHQIDQLALQKIKSLPWLLKCHSIDTCINAFDERGQPLFPPAHMKVCAEKIMPEITYYGAKITPDLLQSILNMYSFGQKQPQTAMYTQENIDLAAWKAYGRYQFHYTEVAIEASSTHKMTKRTPVEITASPSPTGPYLALLRQSGAFPNIPIHFHLNLLDGTDDTQLNGLLHAGCVSHYGLKHETSSDGVHTSMSLLKIGASGIVFAPVITGSLTFDLTASAASIGLVAAAGVGLTVYTFQKIIEHERWKGLPPDAKAKANLSTMFDYLAKIDGHAWKCYINPLNWGASLKELKTHTEQEIKKYAKDFIDMHPHDESMQFLGRSLIFAVDTTNKTAMNEWKHGGVQQSQMDYAHFISESENSILNFEKTGNHGACRDISMRLLKYDAKNAIGYFGRSLALEKKSVEKSLKAMDLAITLTTSPENKQALEGQKINQLMRIALDKAIPEKRRELYRKKLEDFALRCVGDHPNAFQYLAKLPQIVHQVVTCRGDAEFLTQAEEKIIIYIESHKEDPRAHLLLSDHYINLERLPEAKKALETILSSENKDISITAHLCAGVIAKLEEEDKDIIVHFEAAIALGHDDPAIHQELADIYYNKHQFSQAGKAYDAYLNHCPDDDQATLNRAFAGLYGLASYEVVPPDVLNRFLNMLGTCKDNHLLSQANLGCAAIYSRDVRTTQLAFERIDAAILNNPSNARAYHLKGRLLVTEGSQDSLTQALRCFEQSQELSPNLLAAIDHAISNYSLGHKADAKAELSSIMQREPGTRLCETDQQAKKQAEDVLNYFERCEQTKTAFVIADIMTFTLNKLARYLLRNSSDTDKKSVLSKTAWAYSVTYPLLKDVGFAWAQQMSKEWLKKQSPWPDTRSEPSLKSDTAWNKKNLETGLFISRKALQLLHFTKQMMPSNEWVKELDQYANVIETGCTVYEAANCFLPYIKPCVPTSVQAYFPDLDTTKQVFGLNPKLLMGSHLIARGISYFWEKNIASRKEKGEFLSEKLYSYILYDAVNFASSDVTGFGLMLLQDPDIYAAGERVCEFIIAHPVLLASVLLGGSVLLAIHYNNVDKETKSENAKIRYLNSRDFNSRDFRVVAESLGDFIAGTLQVLFDDCRERAYQALDVRKLPLPKWEEVQYRYPCARAVHQTTSVASFLTVADKPRPLAVMAPKVFETVTSARFPLAVMTPKIFETVTSPHFFKSIQSTTDSGMRPSTEMSLFY
ncbi:MAG: hypothetical protein NTW94_01700 [Legionellales bacterium]|nr:hypothetical protein [Legionellales bacterium]